MSHQDSVKLAVQALAARNWMSFADLEAESGLSRDQLIASKPDIETGLRTIDPDIRVVSRVDLEPQGFEVAG